MHRGAILSPSTLLAPVSLTTKERERDTVEKRIKKKKRAIREGGGGRVLCLVCARSVAMATDK